ncbi:MAG: hypothetical protein HFH35_02180 [Eubacterium sp.]|nr:hypothetical protein [Eubacterium sp.]
MRKDRQRKRVRMGIPVLFAAMLLFAACGSAKRGGLAQKEGRQPVTAANQEDAQSTADLSQAEPDDAESTGDGAQYDGMIYMVVSHDTGNYQITLLNLADYSQICYEYTEGTEFFDKYGEYTLRDNFTEGKLAVIRRLNSNDTLGAIAFTDTTWEYENVRNYALDPARNRISIADTSYHYDTQLRVFSDGEQADIQAVGESDILNVYGIDRKIYAIVVETGHGTLELSNTKLFEGGWLNLGTKMYAKITPDLSMELPEGIYDFSVANDGYGDSGEIRIRRGKTTKIDLNDYKGEGPKLCKVTFQVDVDNAVVTIDGKKINYKKPKKLRYGVHKLGVYADGYDAWNKQLVINSPKAKIAIVLSEQTDAASDSNESSSGSGTGSSGTGGSRKAGSLAGSLAGSHTGSSTEGSGTENSSSANTGQENKSALANAALGSSLASIITGGDSTDYLDTLSDLVDSLEKLNRSSSSKNNSGQSDDGGN